MDDGAHARPDDVPTTPEPVPPRSAEPGSAGLPAAVLGSSLPRPSGLVLAPFRALRYDVAVAGGLATLTSPPYDVVDTDTRAALEAQSQYNVVRLILPRDAPEGTSPGVDRYSRAAATLQDWRDRGVLRPDDEPALYVYEQAEPGGHAQRGLLGALALTPAQDGIVLPHENTMSATVSDRLALYSAVRADLEPIFLIYDGGGAASAAVVQIAQRPPLVDVALPDGLRHRLWAITDPAQRAAIATDLHDRTALIADGHHRYATYLQRQAAAHADGLGPGPWDFGLCQLVDATTFGPQVHPIHRVLPGMAPAVLAERARPAFTVHAQETLSAALHALDRTSGPAFVLASPSATEAFLLTEPDPAYVSAHVQTHHSAAWAALDVSVLHALLVTVLWRVPDDVEHVGYAHDVSAALRDAGPDGTAVLLKATPVEAVAAVAAAGERMPRKSTLFTPKPRTGLILRDHRDT